MISHSKETEADCSTCQQSQNTTLLGCCLIFTCNNCIKEHSCESGLTIIPISSNPCPTSLTQCARCSTPAILKCQSCKGRSLCQQCFNLIHKHKYSVHSVSRLTPDLTDKEQQLIGNRSSIKKRISLQCEQIRGSKQCDTKQNNLRSFYMLQRMQVKLQNKISELGYFKETATQRWDCFKLQSSLTFKSIREKLAIKEKETEIMIQEIFKQQIQVVEKMIKGINTSKKAFQNLIRLAEHNPNLHHFATTKKTSILQDLKRIEKKLETFNSGEYKYIDSGALQVAGLIESLKPFERVRQSAPIRVIDSTTTINDKSQRSIRLSSKSINKAQITALFKKTAPMVSIITSRKSIFESPRGSVNCSMNSSTKFIKKKQNTTFQNDIDKYLNESKIKKREGINQLKLNSLFESPKGNMKMRESRSKSKSGVSVVKGLSGLNGSFVASSPEKYRIWKR